MRIGSRKLRTALKLLAIASGLLLLLLVASQSLPLFRGVASPAISVDASNEPAEFVESPPLDPAPLSEELIAAERPTFSGSATGRARAHTSAPRFEPKRSTIEVGLPDVPDDAVPMPPHDADADAEAVSDRELRQLHDRLDELERQVADWRPLGAAGGISPEDQRRLDAIADRLEAQQTELRAFGQRLALTEDRWSVLPSDEREPDPDQPPIRSEATPTSRISIRTVASDGESRLVMEARDASLPELFARLGEASGVNLLVAPEVSGTVSLHLVLPNGDAALDAVCRIHRCRHERLGGFVVVSREPVAEPADDPKVRETATKLYQLQHLSGAEIRPYVQALLTPGLGTVSFATIRERVARTEYRDPPRAILVKDTAQVLSAVDQLILELDRPPSKGKALRPVSQLHRMSQSQPAPPKLDPAPPPPSEAWPSRRAPPPEAVVPPVLESTSGPALLLPTGTDLPGPCLDCEVFEPPLVQEKSE